MTTQKPLIVASGTTQRLPDADTLLVGDGIEPSTGTALRIGDAGGTTITTFPGEVRLVGNVTTVTGTTFTTDATFEGNVTFGVAPADTVTFASTTTVVFSSMTAGSVLFAGASGTLSQDNANLFWDNTNNRLGIGTTTPAAKLDVQAGTLASDGSTSSVKSSSTMPASTTGEIIANDFTITGAGSGSNAPYALRAGVFEGYTGNAGSYAALIFNNSKTTATFSHLGAVKGTTALWGEVAVTAPAPFTGYGIGTYLNVGGGTKNVGLLSRVVYNAGATADTSVGVWGGVDRATNKIGVYASIGNGSFPGDSQAFPTGSAALIADNTNETAPIFLARDNGQDTFTISDNGYVTSRNRVADSITAFQVQNAAGTTILDVDTTNQRVGIGTTTPAAKLDVQAGTPTGSTNALLVTGTLNSDAGVRTGADFDFTANGGSGVRQGAQYYLHGTFSANAPTRAFAADNRVPGTGANLFSTVQQFNLGAYGAAGNVLGGVTNVGIAGYGVDGSTLSVGVLGFSFTGGFSAGPNRIGVVGVADTTAVATNIVGGYFGLAARDSANPTFTSSALIADNGSQAVPIFLARDNGTTTFTVGDSGYVTSKNTSDSITAFQVQNAAGTTVLDVDTTNQRVGIGTAAPNSTLQVAGSLALPITALSTATTLDGTHYTVLCNGTFTVTLPAASTCTGRIYNVKNVGTGTITVDGNASETIDGATTYALSTQYQTLTLQCDGSNWFIL